VAAHYGDLLDGFVMDRIDSALEGEIRGMGLVATVTNTLMHSSNDRRRLAQEVLHMLQGELNL
jgi:LPPG:FO 2-phospho-L-lactate transferase